MQAFEIAGMIFEWDDAKAALNIEKHGISFYEAATVFADPRGILLPDAEHSQDEDRFLLIGVTGERKLLTVVHVDRKEVLRIISARPAAPRERRDYEQSGFRE
jgi:uncharacterized DUF497 family protein